MCIRDRSGVPTSGKVIEVSSSARFPFLIENSVALPYGGPVGVLLHALKLLRERALHGCYILPSCFLNCMVKRAPSPLPNHVVKPQHGCHAWSQVLVHIFLYNSHISDSSHTGLHLPVVWFLLPFLAAIVNLDKCGPMMQKPPSNHSCRHSMPLRLHDITG